MSGFGTRAAKPLVSGPLARYARQRAMNTFRTLIAQIGNRIAARRGHTPEVIALPDRSRAHLEQRRSEEKRQTAAQAKRGSTRRAPERPDYIDPYASGRSRPFPKRIAVLLAAIAVPAMAAPGDFGALPGSAPTEAEMVGARLAEQLAENPAMPFERPGMSFPGSAFFFLADPPSDAQTLVALPSTDATAIGAGEADHELGALIESGPAANPFFAGSGLNQQRAQQCLAQAIWYEAASESEAGQRAVAQVVLNRVSHPSWPGSVCGVVYEGSQRSTGCQFSFTCDGSLRRRAAGASWSRAQRIADEALAGSVYRPVGHATHYHTLWVSPYWAPSLEHVGTIGAHRFYKQRGSAGRKEAFTLRYSGFEPGVSGRTAAPSSVEDTTASLPELPSAPGTTSGSGGAQAPRDFARPAGERGVSGRSAGAVSQPVIEPVLADPALTTSGQAREEYANAGRWKDESVREALEQERRERAERPER